MKSRIRSRLAWVLAPALALLAPTLPGGGPALAQERPGAPPAGPELDAVASRNDDLTRAFAPLARRVAEHVVRVIGPDGRRTRGYGVVIEGGFVLTADSVVAGGEQFLARTAAGDLPGLVIGRDPANDLALLQLQGAGPAPIPFGRSADLAIGQFVVTVGTEGRPLAVGVVSAKDRPVEARAAGGGGNFLLDLFSDGNEGPCRDYPNVVQHDGPLAPEHFGAPLVDRAGKLVGINVGAPYRGSSHAVGVDQVATVLEGLRAGARPAAGPAHGGGWLGVSCEDAIPTRRPGYPHGLEVVEAEGPAQAAKLTRGDVIVQLDGSGFASIEEFAARLRPRRPGERVRLTILRGGRPVEVEVTLGSR